MQKLLFQSGTEEPMIRLHRVLFPVTALGYGRRLGVWVQGCSRSCPHCISPEMQPADGPAVPLQNLLQQFPELEGCGGLTISGGEPLDQPEAVLALMEWFAARYTDDILIYTGYQLQQLPSQAARQVVERAAAVVEGPYREKLNRGVGLYGSENQHLVVRRYPERYRDFATQARTLQPFWEDDRLLLIGIPSKEDSTEDEPS